MGVSVINSILNSSKNQNGYTFNKIPIGEEVSIIAFKLDGINYLYAQENIIISKNSNYGLKLKKVSKPLFNKLIMQFN